MSKSRVIRLSVKTCVLLEEYRDIFIDLYKLPFADVVTDDQLIRILLDQAIRAYRREKN